MPRPITKTEQPRPKTLVKDKTKQPALAGGAKSPKTAPISKPSHSLDKKLDKKQSPTATESKPRLRRWFYFLAVKTSLAEIMLLASLVLARYLKNVDMSYPSEPLLMIGLLGFLISVIFYVLRLARLSWRASHFAALPLAYAVYSWDYSFSTLHMAADSLIANGASQTTHALLELLLMIAVFGAVAHLVDYLLKRSRFKQWPILKFSLFVVAFIFTVQLVKVTYNLSLIWPNLNYKVAHLPPPDKKLATGDKPNIYYLVFDRYTSYEVLQDELAYDNSQFDQDIKQLGLFRRTNAYANYPFTTESISSTLAANYHNQLSEQFGDKNKGNQPAFAYRAIFNDPPVVQALKDQGYQYNVLSSWWDFSRGTPAADSEPSRSFRLQLLGHDFWLSDLQRDILAKSFLGPISKSGGVNWLGLNIISYDLDRTSQQNYQAEIDDLRQIIQNSPQMDKPQLTFAHILSPHPPQFYDADCLSPPTAKTENGRYLDQISCINKTIVEIIRQIRNQDPESVIIMQADEGLYPEQFQQELPSSGYWDPLTLSLSQLRQKFGVMAYYYFPGATATEAKAKVDSSVNSFRFLLSHYFGYDMPPLPDCQFAVGSRFSIYDFTLVNQKLAGQSTDPACNQYK